MAKFTITPPSGKPVTVEAASQEEALDHVLNAEGPDVTSLGSFGRGALSMLPLGDQAYAGVNSLSQHVPYNQARQQLDQQTVADKDVNPGARLAGQVAGVAAPIVATAGLAAPESLAAAAGQGALLGGGFGGGKAIDTLASGGSGAQAAGDVALGAGVGALGGAAGEGLTGLLGKVAGATVPSADEISAGAVARSLGTNTRQLMRMGGKDPVKMLNELKPTLLNSEVDGKPLMGLFDQMPDKLEKMNALQTQSGKIIGDTIRDSGVEPTEVGPLIDQLKAAKQFPTPPEAEHLNSIVERVKQYADANGKMPFEAMQKLKSDLAKDAFHGQGDPLLQQAWKVVSDAQDSELERLGGQINKPAFDLAKQQYRLASLALPSLRRSVSKELSNHAALTVPGAAVVTGHPLVGGLALLKPRLEEIANNAALKLGQYAPEQAGQMLQRAAPNAGAAIANEELPKPQAKASTDLHLEHPAMARWRPIFQQNAAQAKSPAEAEKSNAVTDFTLSQRDPAYAEAKQKATENPEQNHKPVAHMAEGGLVESADAKLFGDEPQENMANGGLVEKLQNMGPVPGFGSTLQGFQNLMGAPAPAADAPPSHTATHAASVPMEQPFNSQMSDQLKKYFMEPDDER